MDLKFKCHQCQCQLMNIKLMCYDFLLETRKIDPNQSLKIGVNIQVFLEHTNPTFLTT